MVRRRWGGGKGLVRGQAGGKVCAWGREGSGRIWIATRRLGSRRGAPRRYKDRGAPVVCAYNGTWAGESSRCEDPAPTAGMAGRSLRVCRTDYHLRPRGHQRERRMRRLRRGAPRRYVLRETGESVLNRRIPKGNRGERPGGDQSFIGGLLAGKGVLIN